MVQAFVTVWEEMMTFIIGLFTDISAIFWTPPAGDSGTGQLTFIGILAVIAVAISFFTYVFGVIQNFIRLRS